VNEPDWLSRVVEGAGSASDPWVLLEGREAVAAALAGWWEVAGVLVDGETDDDFGAWSGLEVLRRPAGDLARIGDPARHGGVVGWAKRPAEATEVAAFARGLDAAALLVVCPRLADPWRTGEWVREALRQGAAGVLCGAEGASPFSPEAIHASEGAVFRLPVRVADGGQLLRSLKAAAVELVGLEAAGERVPPDATTGRRALVVGDPVKGLGPFWRAACDRVVAGDAREWLSGSRAAR
jgi:tRNA G18 (ribose-2'-O)-methylase SpoU